jgi:quercetin dioxygenase-like cupin family protein
MRRHVIQLSPLLALLTVGVTAAEDPVVPVYHEPHHRQVFQYGPMRILDLQIPPGTTTWFHTHEAPVLYVNLVSSQSRSQNLGEEWGGGGPRNPGANGPTGPGGTNGDRPAPPRPGPAVRVFSTTSYAEKPVTHRLENVGERLSRAIVVINETAGDETTTEQAAGFEMKPELTNRWYRAYRITLGPGETTGSHRHQAPVAIVQTLDGHARANGAMKFELNEPGQWAFFDAGDSHEIRNSGDARFEFVEVEIRKPVGH